MHPSISADLANLRLTERLQDADRQRLARLVTPPRRRRGRVLTGRRTRALAGGSDALRTQEGRAS